MGRIDGEEGQQCLSKLRGRFVEGTGRGFIEVSEVLGHRGGSFGTGMGMRVGNGYLLAFVLSRDSRSDGIDQARRQAKSLSTSRDEYIEVRFAVRK